MKVEAPRWLEWAREIRLSLKQVTIILKMITSAKDICV
jgi:hypothetical protein